MDLLRWVLAWFLAIAGLTMLSLLSWAARRDRKIWAKKMEAIERRHTAALCESGAKHARFKMRIRALKRLLGYPG